MNHAIKHRARALSPCAGRVKALWPQTICPFVRYSGEVDRGALYFFLRRRTSNESRRRSDDTVSRVRNVARGPVPLFLKSLVRQPAASLVANLCFLKGQLMPTGTVK